MYFEMDCPCKGKYLDKMLQPAILTLLYHESLHGFVLIQKLGENPMFGGSMPDKTGVYRYLKKMEESQLLESDWELDQDGEGLAEFIPSLRRGSIALPTGRMLSSNMYCP